MSHWIKFDTATHTKPEVYAIAEALSIEPDAVVGKLLKVWGWFDENTEGGNVTSVTDVTVVKLLDDLVKRPGFAEAMRNVGWLDGAAIPKFDRHNGKSAKKRALTAERVSNFRAEKSNAGSVTREEKRREEIKPTALSGEKLPDSPKTLEAKARRKEAQAAGERTIVYLNERAGTTFPVTEVNVALPKARIEGDGATEEQLRQVIDAKVKEWGNDAEMRKFLRPATLFNRTNFAQYVGQIISKPVAPAKTMKDVNISAKQDDGKLFFIHKLSFPIATKVDAAAVAKGTVASYTGFLSKSTARYIVVDVEGAVRATFAIEELR